MRSKNLALNWPLITALIIGNGLMLTPEGSVLRLIGALMLLLLPGLAWVQALDLRVEPLARWSIGLGLSYALMMIVGLLLHYVPGTLSAWMVIIASNLLMLIAVALPMIIWPSRSADRPLLDPPSVEPAQTLKTEAPLDRRALLMGLLFILLIGGIFRWSALGYSEFQGDEVKALVPAAEAIEGRAEALFYQRKKGPGEILVPMLTWSMTGLINETSARALFALAGMMTIVTLYVLGRELFNPPIGLIAAALVALNGFMVAFSRIVQYQQLVIWLSLLAVLCAWYWRQDGRVRWGVLSGLFLAAGMLAHFDAILAAPAIAFLVVSDRRFALSNWRALLIGAITFVMVVLLFFAPYFFSSQLASTGNYLERRIGLNILKNSLADFYHYTIFYNSFYYVVIMGLLTLTFLVWALAQIPMSRLGRFLLPILAVVAVIGLALWPQALTIWGADLAAWPFALIFLGAALSPALSFAERLVTIWFGVGFLTYNFLIADPRTHFYTIVPPWTLLAAIMAVRLAQFSLHRYNSYLPVTAAVVGLGLLFSGYLYVVYLRQEPEFEIDWPDSQPWLYWSPYDRLQLDDSFGMVHRVGWKAVGGLYLEHKLTGDYQTNGLFETGDWYTRHQLRGCYRQSNYFLAMSYHALDTNGLPNYAEIAEVELPNGKGITIYQVAAHSQQFDKLNTDNLNRLFDRTARPTAFVQPIPIQYPADVDLAGFVRLTDYAITMSKLHPGDSIGVTLNWKLEQYVALDLDVFVHLESQQNAGTIWGQSNGSPSCGYSTSQWPVDTVVTDSHILKIDPNTPPGDYTLIAGMYLPADNRRLPVFDETGQPVAESIELATITVY